MVSEQAYRELLEKSHEGSDPIRIFLLAIQNDAIEQTTRTLASETIESLHALEGSLDHLWDLFKREHRVKI